MGEQVDICSAFKAVRNGFCEVAKMIKVELDNEISLRGRQSVLEKSKIYSGKKSSAGNDYRDFVLVYVCDPEAKLEHWISLVTNDIDPSTGNPHSQIGRIQYWKNVPLGGSPHKIIEGRQQKSQRSLSAGNSFIHEYNGSESMISSYSLRDDIFDKATAKSVVQEFFDFTDNIKS